MTCRALRLPSPFIKLSSALRCNSSVCAGETPVAASTWAKACISAERLPEPIMTYVRSNSR